MRKKDYKAIISLLVIVTAVWYVFYDLYPSEITDLSTQSKDFSTLRALSTSKILVTNPTT